MSLPVLLLLATLSGCSNPYEDAQKADTIEAYEKFIAENPGNAKVGAARARLGELKLEGVRKAGTLEAYDAFVNEFKKGKAYEAAMKERKPLLVAWAEQQDSVESWQKVMDDYGKRDRKLLLTSQRRMAAARDRDKIGLGEVTWLPVNMAGDPKGAADGMMFQADVTNKAEVPTKHVVVAAVFTKDDGTALATREWPVVSKRLPEALPLPPGFDTPMAPGETRRWSFKTASLPEGWTKVKLRLAEVKWEGTEAPATDPAVAEPATDAPATQAPPSTSNTTK